MALIAAVVLVAVGSALFRLLPLLAGARVPDRLTRVASFAGLSALVAIVTRGVLMHQPAGGVPSGTAIAAAGASVMVGLIGARRGWPLALAVLCGLACYAALSQILSVLG